ncbi:3256_t:CDS:2, partial [Dentiscutata erythropus]
NHPIEEPIQFDQEQQYNDQEFIQSDEESDCSNENDDYIIQANAEFPNWTILESALKKYELEVEFKAIKYRIERDNDNSIIRRYFVCENSKEYQCKKKLDSTDHRERESKKVGKKFAPSLRSLSQE